jgi:hypothetical protein
MKITVDRIIDDECLVGHMILNGIGPYPDVINAIQRDGVADVRLSVNGAEIDIESFVNHWQSQVEKMIHEEAVKLVEDKFNEVRDQMTEFTNALSDSLTTLAGKEEE